MKNSNDIIGNRARDLPASSAVSQPTAPSRAPILMVLIHIIYTMWGSTPKNFYLVVTGITNSFLYMSRDFEVIYMIL
jgi:hypothetical protein